MLHCRKSRISSSALHTRRFSCILAAMTKSIEQNNELYALTWTGKQDAIRIAHIPTRLKLHPLPAESLEFDKTENIFIEGDNLEGLKLLRGKYTGRIKMIYIDPPYNTRNDFVYNDNFSDPLHAYLKKTGQKNKGTNTPEINGRFHAAWLSMMYPRLMAARELLADQGVIFVSIDDNEVHNLRLIMNEIFGEECFKNTIIFRRGIKSVQAQFDTVSSLTVGHEYVLMYAKNPAARFRKLEIELEESKPGAWNNHWRGTNRPTMRYELFGITPERGQWRWGRERSLKAIENYKRMLSELGTVNGALSQEQIDAWYLKQIEATGEKCDLLRLSASGKPEHYVPPTGTKLGSDLWIDLNPKGTNELDKLLGTRAFDNPKPTALIRRMLKFTTEPHANDIVLDFFAGSGSTAQAVMELNREDGGNRKFILIQIPEPLDHRDFRTIAEVCKERIRRVARQMKSQEIHGDFGFKVFKLGE